MGRHTVTQWQCRAGAELEHRDQGSKARRSIIMGTSTNRHGHTPTPLINSESIYNITSKMDESIHLSGQSIQFKGRDSALWALRVGSASKYWAWPFLFPVIERKVDVIAFRGWNLASRTHLDHDHVSLVMTIHFDPRPDLSLAQDQKLANGWKHWNYPC